jgi:cytochrome P450
LDEVVGIGIQAISAAVDTTSKTTEYLLYNLAKNSDVQDRLAAEFSEAFGTDGPLTINSISDFEKMSYLFATLKESMRLTPTISTHVRTLRQDAQLGNYRVSEGEKVFINYQQMTTNSDFFPEPDLFLPERFLKQKLKVTASTMPRGHAVGRCPRTSQRIANAIENGQAVCNEPYAAIPFGHGSRKCLGKGFAEMNIHLATIALLRKFRIHYDGPDLVRVEKHLLRLKEPIHPHFRFELR